MRRAAAAVELFQLATLAHDDVVDDAHIRRGTEAVGIVYGAVASGFAGGVLFARALELISSCGDEPTRRFVRTAGEVCAGEIAEFHDVLNVDRSLEQYHAAISGKTARLFQLWRGLARSLREPPAIAEHLARFGHEFGMAFQIADDILDLVGDPEHTGKALAKDLEQGIYTLPVIHTVTNDKALRNALLTAGPGRLCADHRGGRPQRRARNRDRGLYDSRQPRSHEPAAGAWTGGSRVLWVVSACSTLAARHAHRHRLMRVVFTS